MLDERQDYGNPEVRRKVDEMDDETERSQTGHRIGGLGERHCIKPNTRWSLPVQPGEHEGVPLQQFAEAAQIGFLETAMYSKAGG